MEIDKIRNEALTEDSKMEAIADYLEGAGGKPTLDVVLENGNTAIGKEAKFETENSPRNFSIVSGTQLYTQKEDADGATIVQITSDGKLSVDYGPAQGNPSFFTIEMKGGQPKVTMTDDVKAAFRAALGISEEV